MPLYDYYCPNCNKRFEVILPLKDSDVQLECKYCGQVMEKIICAPMFKVN